METNSSSEYAQLAVAFTEHLLAGRFEQAHQLLSKELQQTSTPSQLERTYSSMIAYASAPANRVELVTTLQSWPDWQSGDLGWAYVAIEGDGFSEAVAVIVCREEGKTVIRQLEWGRP